MLSGAFAVAFLSAPCCGANATGGTLGPEKVLVVYNSALPESRAIALAYAGQREIRAERVVGLPMPDREEISRREYEETILGPIEDLARKKGWIERVPQRAMIHGKERYVSRAIRNDIWAIVLCWGVPLKISGQGVPVDKSLPEAVRVGDAAVDSELATLPVSGLPLSGGVPNPFFRSREPYSVTQSTMLTIVTRLDGPDPATVQARLKESMRMVSGATAVVDARGLKEGHYKIGDDWLRACSGLLSAAGVSVTSDDQEPLIGHLPTSEAPSIYLGWYAENLSGFASAPGFKFAPGSLAIHIHSFSAHTLRSKSKQWVGPLVDRGAAFTIGNVYEPYLQLTPHLDVMLGRLLNGDSFGESVYAATPWLSWMGTVVGDPLAKPLAAVAAQSGGAQK